MLICKRVSCFSRRALVTIQLKILFEVCPGLGEHKCVTDAAKQQSKGFNSCCWCWLFSGSSPFSFDDVKGCFEVFIYLCALAIVTLALYLSKTRK